MQINGILFNVDLIDILSELKTQLSINGVQRFAKMTDSGDDIMVCCPYHKGGQEKRPSAGIRKSDGMFHCLACGKTTSLDEMIANCFGKADPLWGYQWLTQNFLTVGVSNRETITLNLGRNNITDKDILLGYNNPDKHILVVSEQELDTYRYIHPYMYERGLNDSIIDLFDIGYDRHTDSITFPVKNSTGDCIFVARRNIHTKRFDIPKGIEKPLYGLYESGIFAWQQLGRGQSKKLVGIPEVYVCEGLFDCLRLWCNGKVAVAGFGCLFSDYQIKQLQDLPTRHLILALDNDEAGREATKKLRKAIKNKLITEVVIPKGKKDIGELTDEEIQHLDEVF